MMALGGSRCFSSRATAAVPPRAGMRRFHSDLWTGHDQPFQTFCPAFFFQKCYTRSTSCVVSTRSRKVISATEIDAGCGRGRMLSPLASGQVRLWYASKHTGHRRGRDQQVCSGSKRLFQMITAGWKSDHVREITRRSSVEDDMMRVLVRHLGRHVGNFRSAAMHVPVAEGSSLNTRKCL